MNAVVIVICLFIIFFSIKNGFRDIRKLDIFVLIIAILAIIMWLITYDAFWSVILISFANIIAYIPTFRKSYSKPYEEAVYLYGINFFRHGISIMALTNISIITALFPLVLAISNGALAIFLIWRRYKISSK